MRERESTKVLFDKVIQKISTARVKQVRIAFGEICEGAIIGEAGTVAPPPTSEPDAPAAATHRWYDPHS